MNENNRVVYPIVKSERLSEISFTKPPTEQTSPSPEEFKERAPTTPRLPPPFPPLYV